MCGRNKSLSNPVGKDFAKKPDVERESDELRVLCPRLQQLEKTLLGEVLIFHPAL
jgi:hypothetical protein